MEQMPVAARPKRPISRDKPFSDGGVDGGAIVSWFTLNWSSDRSGAGELEGDILLTNHGLQPPMISNLGKANELKTNLVPPPVVAEVI